MISHLRNAWNTFDGVTSDIFWNTATSYPVLALLGVVALVTFIIGHLPLIERLMPPLAPYIRAAALTSIIATAALLFLVGFRVADQREEAARLQRELNFSNMMLESMEATAKDAQRLREAADAERKETKGQLDVWRSKYGSDPDAACRYPREFLDWLRARHKRNARAG